jgi:hypothetical protein
MLPVVLAIGLLWLAHRGKPQPSVAGAVTFGDSGPSTPEPSIVTPLQPPAGLRVLQAPEEVLPSSPLPGVIPVMMPRSIPERRALASRVAEHLSLMPPGLEDRSLIATFQAHQGLRPSGYYGPSTGLVLADGFGIVPPLPLYWPKTDTKRSKLRYRAAMLRHADREPQRAEEWRKAGDV